MFTLRHTGISGKCLKSVLCLVFTLSPLALTAQSCVLNPANSLTWPMAKAPSPAIGSTPPTDD